MTKWLYLITGGVAGTVARYSFSGWVQRAMGERFPFGTLAVNLTGCFIVGVFTALGEEKMALSYEIKLFLVTGFCGAFTTFSALTLETAGLMKGEGLGMSLLNIAANVVPGYFLFLAGLAAAKVF